MGDLLETAAKAAAAEQWDVLETLAARYAHICEPATWMSAGCFSRISWSSVDALERTVAICGGDDGVFADRRWVSNAIASVVMGGAPVGVAEYLCKRHGTAQGLVVDLGAASHAARRGDIDTLRWLHERLGWVSDCGSALAHGSVLTAAAGTGRAGVVRYLCAQGISTPHMLHGECARTAARSGYIDVFTALRDHGLSGEAHAEIVRDAFEGALKGFRADIVAWLCDAYPQVCGEEAEWTTAWRCPHYCRASLVFRDINLGWMRVMCQHAAAAAVGE